MPFLCYIVSYILLINLMSSLCIYNVDRSEDIEEALHEKVCPHSWLLVCVCVHSAAWVAAMQLRLCNTHVLEQRPLAPRLRLFGNCSVCVKFFPLGAAAAAAARSSPSRQRSDWAAASGVLRTPSSLKKPLPPSPWLSLYWSPSCGCIAFLSLCCLDTHIYIYTSFFFSFFLCHTVPQHCMSRYHACAWHLLHNFCWIVLNGITWL